jgi:hypothetical protein
MRNHNKFLHVTLNKMEGNANDFVNYVVVEQFSQRVRWKCTAELAATRGGYLSKFLSAGFSRYSSRAQQRIFSRFPLPPLKATGDEAGFYALQRTVHVYGGAEMFFKACLKILCTCGCMVYTLLVRFSQWCDRALKLGEIFVGRDNKRRGFKSERFKKRVPT